MEKNSYTITINGTEFHRYFARDAHGSEANIFFVNNKEVDRSGFYGALRCNLNVMRSDIARALNLLLT